MAATLQQQLAAIATNSTHQLDLKAQKTRHSKSLLFEPRDAATQSFDTVYQICYEGFEELCMLDARFGAYGRNIFSEQSKDEDRTQMTAKENEELDQTLESFLGLVGGRLLLKPAMKAVEWLVRRFRVQEYNTEAVLLTFLPYHTSHIFPTLLSILPDQLPPTFRFLHPYVASLQSPPRHAVLSAAISNQGFFSAFSQYVLRVARARHHSAVLLGFWASITAQAVNGMIDSTRSGRESVRRQREEDLLLRILPVLQSALSIKGVPKLYLISCMIMTVLATKASLADRVLDAMMEAVVGAWTPQTTEDGLTCLAIMAEEKDQAELPTSVVRAVLAADDSMRLLRELSEQHRTDKLLISLARSGVDMDSSPELLSLLQQVAERSNMDLSKLLPQLVLSTNAAGSEEAGVEAADAMDVDGEKDEEETMPGDDFGTRLEGLPELNVSHPSFFEPENDDAFRQHSSIFQAAAAGDRNIRRLLELRALQRGKLVKKPTFLTFLARAWTTSQHALTKARALEAAVFALRPHVGDMSLDAQMLLPYAIAALSDDSQRARRAAANLCTAISELHGSSTDKGGKSPKVWCTDSAYGARTASIRALPSQDASRFMASALMPVLEDCVLDSGYATRALADALKGAESSTHAAAGKDAKSMKTALRSEVCTYLASHVVVTPILRVKLRLLEILNRAGKAAGDARKKVLLPFAKSWAAEYSKTVQASCVVEGVAKHDLDRAVIGSLTHRSSDEIAALQEIASNSASDIRLVAFERLRHIFPSVKPQSQAALSTWFLDLALGDTDSSGDALEALRNLDLSTEVLVRLVEILPNASELQDQPPSAKKRRTSISETALPRKVDTAAVNAAVKRVTLVLELVEGAKPEKHPQLLKGLFHLLSELHQYKTMLGSQLVYLQGLLMSCLLAVVNGLKNTAGAADIDRSVIRADLVVEAVRTTSSTQVHNTALLLISSLASWAPELVLHSVMPLFTFMSTTLLRQSDEYSAHVTDQTVARIVPPLAASLKKRGKDLVSGASELLLSFTAAFEHIPLHRRGGLFQHLVQTLGPDEALFAVVAMLVERYPEDDRVQPFVSELMSRFAVATQLRALQQYLLLVFDALKPKRTLSNAVLGLSEKNSEQIHGSVKKLLQALAGLMMNATLRKRLAKEFAKEGSEAEMLRSIYSQLLEQTMQLSRQLASHKALADTASIVLSALLGLTPTKDFIESSAQLMQTGSDETRQQVFHSLEARVTQAKRGDSSLQQTFLEVLPNCCVFVAAEQPVPVRHAAITCMDQIVDKYGKRDRVAVLHAAQTVAGAAALGSEDAQLRVISILCLASMGEVLGDDFIPILPAVLEQALDYLEQTLAAPRLDHKLLNASFTLTSAVLDHLPYMYSNSYLERTLLLAGRTVEAAQSNDSDVAAAEQFAKLASMNIRAETMVTSLDSTFTYVTDLGASAATLHLETIRRVIQTHTKTALQSHLSALSSLLLKAFDMRRLKFVEGGDDGEAWGAVFALVNDVAMDFVLKADDTIFRPFFVRFVEWATKGLPKKESVGRVLRATSLFSFAHRFFEQLQSVITGYSTYVLESAAELLQTLALRDEQEKTLLAAVLQTLSSSFKHDQDDFWQAPDHFDAIAAPLLSLLAKANTVTASTHIIPAIADLAAAVQASTEHLKTINSTIMSHFKSHSPEVRLAVVMVERAITERLEMDWLQMLAEMLPLISELQEDDDEAVEREAIRWGAQIEKVTGESLESMLR